MLITLGKRIRKLRKSLKLSQKQVASEIGICLKTYQQVEVGRTNVEYNTLKNILDRFSMTLDIVPKSEAQLNAEMFGEEDYDDTTAS